MSLDIIQMWAAVTGGIQNGAAVIDVPANGALWGIDWAVATLLNAVGETFYAELSFVATGQAQTNDVRGLISAVRSRMHLLTSGVGVMGINKYVGLSGGLKVQGGERLFVNMDSTIGLAGDVNLYLHFDPTAGAPARRSSRRR